MCNEVLKDLRDKNNLTQKEMAKIMGVTHITYMSYETGKTEPKFNQMVETMLKLGASIKEVFKNMNTSEDEELMYNLKRTEILSEEEKQCINQILEAMLLKHQIDSVERK